MLVALYLTKTQYSSSLMWRPQMSYLPNFHTKNFIIPHLHFILLYSKFSFHKDSALNKKNIPSSFISQDQASWLESSSHYCVKNVFLVSNYHNTKRFKCTTFYEAEKTCISNTQNQQCYILNTFTSTTINNACRSYRKSLLSSPHGLQFFSVPWNNTVHY